MKAKKVMSMLLAAASIASLSVPAFASKSTRITTTYKEIPISVLVPSTGKAFINPYGLPIDVTETNDEGESTTLATISDRKITTMPLAIVNMSTVGLDVGASVTVKPSTGVTIVAEAPAEDAENAKAKWVTLNLDVWKTSLTQANMNAADEEAGTSASVKTADLAKEVVKAAAFTGENNKTLAITGVAADDKSGEDALASLTKMKETEVDGRKTGKYEVASGGVAAFQLSGEVCEDPTTAWNSKDSIEVNVAFTFKPTPKAG